MKREIKNPFIPSAQIQVDDDGFILFSPSDLSRMKRIEDALFARTWGQKFVVAFVHGLGEGISAIAWMAMFTIASIYFGWWK
jgi:hypothetical protein